MLSQLREYITRENLFRHNDRILLAVSGGIDSMVMAHMFLSLHYETGIAHCNFSLRGKESDGDEALVREFASSHGIPFFNVRFETRSYAKTNGISIQMAARELRYKWFEEIRMSNNYNFIAVAHNLNDKIETILINLTRGTGITGLTGMKPVSGTIVRPLLFATRDAINNYCEHNSIEFREDRSNADTKYTRNKIRHKVIPVLKEINPSIEKTLDDTAGRISEINEIVSAFINELRVRVTGSSGGQTSIRIDLIEDYLNNRSILYELFKPYGLSGVQTDDLVNIINGRTGGMLHTGKYRIIRNRDKIIISEEKNEYETPVIIKALPDLLKCPGIISAETVKKTGSFIISSDPSVGCISLEKLVFPLTVRKWKAGDSFFPLGMEQKKKLSDYFTDRKYSIPEKEGKLILESEGKIVWIIGDRLDDRFKITGETREALIIKAENRIER